MKRLRLYALAALLVGTAPVHAGYDEREAVAAYVQEMVDEHGFERAALLALFAQVERQDSILEAIARPAERVLEWHEYRGIFVTPGRIKGGAAFWKRHADTLERAAQTYGVSPQVIVSILGVETRYGDIMGDYRVMDALSTLAFDYPPRSRFFRSELTEFLLLAREEGVDPLSLNGSYAGAMGYGQFIPSSYRAYAVDFDDDGQRDIWKNPVDAIGSIANYLRRHGWDADAPVAFEVDVEPARVAGIVTDGLDFEDTVADLRALGMTLDGVPGSADASLYRMEAADGPEYWVGLNNFRVITRYNHSLLYALTVYQLGEAIADARAQTLASRGD